MLPRSDTKLVEQPAAKQKLRLLVIGCLPEPEIACWEPWQRTVAGDVVFDQVASPCEALNLIERAGASEWDYVVLLQPQPMVATAELDELRSLVGEATCSVQLLGTWCEGEGRTGHVAQGWERIFWHAWPRWWAARQYPMPGSCLDVRRVLVVDAPRTTRETINAVLQPSGWWVVPYHPSQPDLVARADAVLWSGSQLSGAESARLAQLCSAARGGNTSVSQQDRFASSGQTSPQVVALLDFPRKETVEAARWCGASEVMGLPCDLDDLQETLDRITVGREAPQLSAETDLLPLGQESSSNLFVPSSVAA